MLARKSILVASLDEVTKEIESGFSFPAMAIPFGADDTTLCRFFTSCDELSIGYFEELIEKSYPMRDGIRRVHVISVSKTGISDRKSVV